MSAPNPSSSFNLERLKKHAKYLLRACRNGDAGAIAEMQSALSRLASLDPAEVAARIQLADVQHALAVQRGFASWAELIQQGDPLARLLTAVRGGHSRSLRRQLHEFTGLAAVSVHAASALGNVSKLARHIESDRTLATRSDGRWLPLMYVCASPLARFSARHAMSLLTCAELLLDAGAGASIEAADDGASPDAPQLPAILRALMNGNMPLVMVLRKRGAPEPADVARRVVADSLTPEGRDLHAVFGEYFKRPEVRQQMLKAKAEFDAQGGLGPHQISHPQDAQRIRMPNLIGAHPDLWAAMLDRGYDPFSLGKNGQSALHWLATYATPAVVEIVLARGGNPSLHDDQGKSVIATAVRAGNVDVAELLRRRGVDDDSTPMDRLLGACLADDEDGAYQVRLEHPDVPSSANREDADVLVSAGGRGALNQVRLMLDAGISADARDQSGATALHQAAWRGQVEMVRLLLDRGAGSWIRDELYGETPREWALHGAVHAQGVRDQCVAIAELLAGAE